MSAPWYVAAIRLASVSPGANSDAWMPVWLPITWVTAIASPNARPRPSSTAAAIPGAAYGIATLRIASHLRRAERERAVGEIAGHAAQELTAERRDDRDDHDRQDERGREDTRLAGRAGEDRQEAERTSAARARDGRSPTARRRGCPRDRARRSGSPRAARRSSRSAPRAVSGAISVRNSAIAIESGVAISSAMNDVTIVP